MKNKIYVMMVLAIIFSSGCASSENNKNYSISDDGLQGGGISYGLIKRELIVGVSTQEDVVKKFGSPNNMIYGSKGEIWIYDQIHTESVLQFESRNSGVGVGGVAPGGSSLIGASAGIRNSQGSTRSASSVKMLTVILEFDSSGLLKDISARKGGY
jgi:hypothetical protein